MKKKLLLIALIACTKMSFSQNYNETGQVLIDLGSNNPTILTGWNNILSPLATAEPSTTLVNSVNQATPFKAYIHDSFNTSTFVGLTVEKHGYPATAIVDSFYGNGVLFSGATEPTAGITLSNLDPDKVYTLKFFGARADVTDNRETQYTVIGKTTQILLHNAAMPNGTSSSNPPVSTTEMEPDATGKITINVTYGSNNNNGSKFFYVGVIDIAYKPKTLPITINSFEAINKNDGITLKWQTSLESNSSHFEILRSSDANNFTSIGTVAGKGNSNSIIDYTFTDFNPKNGTNYYQLKMIDLDDKFSLSKILPIKAGLNTKTFEANYIDGYINLFFNNEGKTNVASIIVSDISGRKIGSYNKNVSTGFNKLSLNTPLANGIYIINFSSGNSTYKVKFIVGN